MGKPEAAQHVGQVYSHLPHTEPSYPKQNGKEQKQRVSESTAQAAAGPRGPGGRDTQPCPLEGVLTCVCVCVRACVHVRALLGWSPLGCCIWAARAQLGTGCPAQAKDSGPTNWRGGRAVPVTKEGLPRLADVGRACAGQVTREVVHPCMAGRLSCPGDLDRHRSSCPSQQDSSG